MRHRAELALEKALTFNHVRSFWDGCLAPHYSSIWLLGVNHGPRIAVRNRNADEQMSYTSTFHQAPRQGVAGRTGTEADYFICDFLASMAHPLSTCKYNVLQGFVKREKS
jgi:hypothetical protein